MRIYRDEVKPEVTCSQMPFSRTPPYEKRNAQRIAAMCIDQFHVPLETPRDLIRDSMLLAMFGITDKWMQNVYAHFNHFKERMALLPRDVRAVLSVEPNEWQSR